MEFTALNRGGGRLDEGSLPVAAPSSAANVAHAGAPRRPGAAERLAKLCDRVKVQVRQWEAEVGDLEARADALQAEARSRAEALLADIDARLKRWDPRASEPEGQVESSPPGQLPDDARLAQLRRWRCELVELRASAYKADAQARHAHQHQIALLQAAIDEQTRAWQQELIRLDVEPGAVWTVALCSQLEWTQRKLSGWGGAGVGTWPGFAGEVEEVLSQAEQRLFDAAAGIAAEW